MCVGHLPPIALYDVGSILKLFCPCSLGIESASLAWCCWCSAVSESGYEADGSQHSYSSTLIFIFSVTAVWVWGTTSNFNNDSCSKSFIFSSHPWQEWSWLCLVWWTERTSTPEVTRSVSGSNLKHKEGRGPVYPFRKRWDRPDSPSPTHHKFSICNILNLTH